MDRAAVNMSDSAGDHQQPGRPIALQGHTVRVDFMVWVQDGTLVGSSINDTPLTFTIGTHSVMQGIENLVNGMSVGESRTQRLPADLTFGPYRPELSCRVNRRWLEAQHVDLQVGVGLEIRKQDGAPVYAHITEIDDDHVTLDANHRLAGREIVVQLDLLEILDLSGLSDNHMPLRATS